MKPHTLLATTLLSAAGLIGLAMPAVALAAGDASAASGSAATLKDSSTGTSLSISNGWVRWLPNGLPEAGYLTITNNGDQPVDLQGASSPDFASVMLHQSIGNGSAMRMVMVDKLTIPAHGKVDIAPGGYHLMLMTSTRPIAPGAKVQVYLHFSDGKTLATGLPVRSASGQ